MLARFVQRIGDGFRMSGDDGEQDAGWSVGARAALLPVAQSRGREAEPGGKLRLAESHAAAEFADVDVGNAHEVDAGGRWLTLGPPQSLLKSFDDPRADGGCRRRGARDRRWIFGGRFLGHRDLLFFRD